MGHTKLCPSSCIVQASRKQCRSTKSAALGFEEKLDLFSITLALSQEGLLIPSGKMCHLGKSIQTLLDYSQCATRWGVNLHHASLLCTYGLLSWHYTITNVL